MQPGQQRSCGARLRGFFLLSHPGPVSFHLVAVAFFALLAMWPHVTWSIILPVVGAHTAMQLSIAMFNDYCDRTRDAVGKPEKPIPRGLLTPGEALLACGGVTGLMFLLLIPLPWLAWLFSLLYLTLGTGYNLGLKGTPLSGAVFALAMPLIPLYAFAGAGRSVLPLVWLVPLGLLLGITLNLANALPDLEKDADCGARTLAVVLGLRRAFLVSNTLLVLAMVLILALDVSGLLRVQPLVLLLTLGLTALLLTVILLSTGPDKTAGTRKRYFYLVTLTCLLLAAGWLIGVFIV
ncbi:MAG TPA: UbiA family prenyltransferase [Ktedonobacteraceae bacterium]|jgi:geranylgeranylglycerol-phosphate geranylgeranyltransferase